jgi:hypothetical protein
VYGTNEAQYSCFFVWTKKEKDIKFKPAFAGRQAYKKNKTTLIIEAQS